MVVSTPGTTGGDADVASVTRARGLASCVAILPAWNEAPTLGDVVAGLRGRVERVLVVDDGSTDATAARAREAGAEVLSLGTNRGKGAALRAGLAW
ncbi:MAG: glycosyltransferase, partial [Verrucomicrobiales bacterium]|nr:glycosyltransferase [Verrucomicrobiales bacterium]